MELRALSFELRVLGAGRGGWQSMSERVCTEAALAGRIANDSLGLKPAFPATLTRR
jgi:hypothetical protein